MGDFWDQTASSMVRLGSVANLQRLGLERFHCIAVHVQYAHAHTTAFCIFLQFQSESRKGPSRLLFNIERIAAIIGQDVLRDMVYVQGNIGELQYVAHWLDSGINPSIPDTLGPALS